MIATVLDPDIGKHVDSILLRQHFGTATQDDAIQLRRVALEWNLSSDDLAERKAAAIKRKADYAASKSPPKFKAADGEIVTPIKAGDITDRYLRYADPSQSPSAEFIDDLLQGAVKIPVGHLDRRHRAKGQDKAEFEYLLSLLRSLHTGEITPGKVAFVVSDRDENRTLPPRRLQTLIGNEPLLGNGWDSLTLVRAPGQTEAAFERAKKELAKSMDQRDAVDGCRPSSQARFGGKR